ncbi:hypothetical protein V5O48_009946 [Marasmius crinis-equi]|uniref:AB hydrolase-1 domain-containing protein n=1 Tax=Marasmius crinis-equi TaxID=585013 RepID=A0ABR3F9P1_9AGAR
MGMDPEYPFYYSFRLKLNTLASSFNKEQSIMRVPFPSLTTTLALVLAVSGARGDILDPSNYKNTTVSRGINYSYYFSPPTNNQRSLVFLHGWPGLSYDWRFQVDFFKDAGYGIIVPDMLGYGGTDKPTDPEVYKSSLISRDIVDILDTESVRQDVVVIGHDWGAKIAGRLASYFPDRFSAFGFLAVGNLPPAFFSAPYNQLNTLTKAVFGYELFGYWELFSRPGAQELLGSHLESLLNLAHSADPADVVTNFAPLGALEAYVKEDRKPASTVWTPEEAEIYLKAYRLPDALEASLSWYRVLVSDIEAKDNQGIPPENLIVTKPVFFVVLLRVDWSMTGATATKSSRAAPNSTIRYYDAGHWAHWVVKDEVNRDLLAWVQGLE